jgi:hypothetical protein
MLALLVLHGWPARPAGYESDEEMERFASANRPNEGGAK